MADSRWKPVFYALLAALLFGASTPLAKMLLGTADSVFLAGLFYLGSGIGVGTLLLLQQKVFKRDHREAPLLRQEVPWLAGAVLAGGVAAPILLMISLRHTPAASAALLLNFEGVATTLIAVLAFHEAVGKRTWLAMALVTLACLVLSWQGNALQSVSWGGLGILGACILWGLDNNLTRNISAKDPLAIVTIKGLGAGAFSLLLALILGRPFPGWGVTAQALLIGFVCYGISIVLYVLALRGLGSARTGTLYAAAPFMGVILSLILLHEKPNWLFFAGLPLMLLGTLLMSLENHHHVHTHEACSHEHAHTHPDPHHQHLHADRTVFVGTHSHPHQHESLTHDHAHTPDIYHRHSHFPG